MEMDGNFVNHIIHILALLPIAVRLECGSCFSSSKEKIDESAKENSASRRSFLPDAYSFIYQNMKELSGYNFTLLAHNLKISEFRNQCAVICKTKEELEELEQLINVAHNAISILERGESSAEITIEDIIKCIYQVRANYAKIEALQKLATQDTPKQTPSSHDAH